MLTTRALSTAGRLVDGVLVVLVVLAAFLLGCQELFDADVWWHVRAGQWIWANGRVPASDPFTFGSANRPWIDLHWLFQLMLAAAHGIGGVAGMILLASSIYASMILVGLTTRDRRWPMAVIAACWLPASGAMSSRFDPRPEAISLLGVAVYLAVLFRTDRRPALAWLLPLVQVIWVNSHALFVLGPLILGAYLVDHIAVAALTGRPLAGGNTHSVPGRRWWLHLGGAALALVPACLVNPYGWRGALLPFEVFPKITAWGGPAKSYVGENMDLRTFVQTVGLEGAAGNFFFRAECFLLVMLPLSLIVPAVWRLAPPASSAGAADQRRSVPWLVAFGLAVGLVTACWLGFAEAGTAAWIAQIGHLAPWGLVAGGILGAVLLLAGRSSVAAALLAVSGGAAEAAWIVWLRGHLSGAEPRLYVAGIGAIFGLTATVIILRHRQRGRLFRVILSVAFAYLALIALRNINLFALVAGFVMAWNLGEWAFELTSVREETAPVQWSLVLAGLIGQGGLAVVVGWWIVAIVSGGFFGTTGEVRRFGLRESPLAYAHAAAKFAGRPGMPERALALDLRQAAVYLFHNGPDRKIFFDGRLEIPTRATFDTFVRLGALLNEGRAGWAEAVARLGNPLILLDHVEDFGAEATLVTQPGWRCVYYDPVASVFVADRPGALADKFPTVDFAARHFRDPVWRATPVTPLALAEAGALIRLGSTIGRRPGSRWDLRFSLMLLACDRLRQGIASGFGGDAGLGATTAGLWNSLGHCSWNMSPNLKVPPAGPDEPWDPARGLLMAQATFSYRRSLEIDPRGTSALAALHDSFKARRMADAQRAAIAGLRRLEQARPSPADEARAGANEQSQSQDGRDVRSPAPLSEPELARAVSSLIEKGQPEAAVRLFAEGVRQGLQPSWPVIDRVAATLLQLGRPIEARELWERAASPPSRAGQLARVATAALAAFDFEIALQTYRSALDLDPNLAEAWFGVALLRTQQGDAAAALTAARKGLKQNLTPAQKAFLAAIEALVAPYAEDKKASPP